MIVKWALVALVLGQDDPKCPDPYTQFANTNITTWKKRDCTKWDNLKVCTVKCLDGYRQAQPYPISRLATKV